MPAKVEFADSVTCCSSLARSHSEPPYLLVNEQVQRSCHCLSELLSVFKAGQQDEVATKPTSTQKF